MSYPMSFSRREVSRFKHHLFYHYGLQVHSLEGHRLPLSAEVVAWIKCGGLHKCYPQAGLTLNLPTVYSHTCYFTLLQYCAQFDTNLFK